jgi:hypothetical protein
LFARWDSNGYTPNGATLYAWLRAHAKPVYVFDGRSYGRLEVYRITGSSEHANTADRGFDHVVRPPVGVAVFFSSWLPPATPLEAAHPLIARPMVSVTCRDS